MRQSRLYSTEAIVLRHRKSGEADCILTLYTVNSGKKTVVARGVRKTGSKLGGHLEVLNHVRLLLAQGQNMDTVSQGETQESFIGLRNDLESMSRAVYLVDLVDCFTVENEANAGLFYLLLESLRWLEKFNSEKVLRYFELHLLEHLGYRPELYRCINCSCPLEPVKNFFSVSAGGVLCPACTPTEHLVRPLTVNALKLLRLYQKDSPGLVRRVKIDAELSQEMEHLLRSYISYLLERDVKSAEWLSRLRRESLT